MALDLPRQGEVRRGVIASVAKDEVLVSIGSKSEGVIPARELEQLTEEDRAKLIVGDEIMDGIHQPQAGFGQKRPPPEIKGAVELIADAVQHAHTFGAEKDIEFVIVLGSRPEDFFGL